MIRQFILYFLVGIIMVSCSNKRKEGTASISGSCSDWSGQWMYLKELEVKRLVVIDSVKVDDKGNFRFNPELTEPAFYILESSGDNRLTLLIDKAEKIEISCQAKSLSSGTVTGSPGSQLLLDFEQFMIKQKQKTDSLAGVFYAYEGTPDFLKKKRELDSAYVKVLEVQRGYVMNFINNNPGSLASLLILNRKLGKSKVMDEEKDYIYFHRVDSALYILYPGNKHVLDHHKRVEEIRGRKFDRFTADEKLKPGKKAPNIVVRDTSHHPVALKSLEGKNVLICFWAGWDAKSRQDNGKLIELYLGFGKHNIEVFGVSLDENEIIWKGAVKLDRLPGIQGSDLKGLQSEVMKDYNLLDRLPYYYIIDKERKIIYHDRDFGKIIEQLGQIF